MHAKLISNLATNVAAMTAWSQVSVLSAFMEEIRLQTNNQKNLAINVRVAFMMLTPGVVTHSARSLVPSVVKFGRVECLRVIRARTIEESVDGGLRDVYRNPCTRVAVMGAWAVGLAFLWIKPRRVAT
ncbi:hypothetical protein H5410_001737 [Solanum commersonii]|uniref:Uncharacterized protein n=1 Tax=Solanum commersonii TaxID=4109 RepID=A0A9J6B002_SOLCO|nr:hypothetical protein H5410_001737 [Solanum commersonii]